MRTAHTTICSRLISGLLLLTLLLLQPFAMLQAKPVELSQLSSSHHSWSGQSTVIHSHEHFDADDQLSNHSHSHIHSDTSAKTILLQPLQVNASSAPVAYMPSYRFSALKVEYRPPLRPPRRS